VIPSNLILLAENSEDDELLFLDVLKRSGLNHPVIVVPDGQEAIAYFKGDSRYVDRDRFPLPNILLLDLAMPKVDGWQVLQWIRLRAEFNHVLVVVLTASTRVADLQQAYRMGANSFLVKPCTVDDLLNLERAFPKHWQKTETAERPAERGAGKYWQKDDWQKNRRPAERGKRGKTILAKK
jgi:CheY-like chemotaxis protein